MLFLAEQAKSGGSDVIAIIFAATMCALCLLLAFSGGK